MSIVVEFFIRNPINFLPDDFYGFQDTFLIVI